MTTPPLMMEVPESHQFDPDPGERELSKLYEHPMGTWRLGLIRSRDGYLAGPDGSSRSLSGPADLRVMRALRVCADTVLIGATTARTEGYRDNTVNDQLSATRLELGLAAQPHVVVVSATGNLGDVLSPAHTVVAAPVGAELDPRWTRVLRWSSLEDLVAQVSSIGQGRVLCEGGGQLAWALHDHGAFNEWCLTTSVHDGDPLSETCPQPPESAQLLSLLRGDNMSMGRWRGGEVPIPGSGDGFVMERWALPSSP